MSELHSFGNLLLETVNRNPNKIAIIDGNNKITYKELLLRVIQIQKQLSQIIKPNSVVGLLLPNSIDYIASYFAISMHGATLLPLYWNLSPSEIQQAFAFTNAEFIVTNEDGVKKTKEETKTFVLQKEQELDTLGITVNKSVEKGAALLLQTSGTTSMPKVVSHSYKTIITNARNHIESLGLTSDDIVLITLPMPFGYCNTSQFLAHISLGGTLVLNNKFIHPRQLFNLIEENSVTLFTAVPTILMAFALIKKHQVENYNLASLRMICFGGGALSNNTVINLRLKFPNVTLVQTYGQTEAGPRITSKIISEEYYVTNVGKPLNNTQIVIKDESGFLLDTGSIGEICVKSPSIMEGYFRNPEATNMVIKNGYLHTGDIGFLDGNNELHIKGRIGNMFKSNGLQVYPEEIEDFIKENFPVEHVVVKRSVHQLYGFVPVAAVTPYKNINHENLIKSIKKGCKEQLSPHKVPRKVIITNVIHTTITGKVKR